jgi:prophage regulatory protein
MQKILRLKDVIQIVGLSRSSIYALKASGDFPDSFMLSKRAVAWLDSEIQQWIEERIQFKGFKGQS